MASITKTKNGWRVQVARRGVRLSKICKTKTEANLWAAAKETEIITTRGGGSFPRKTLGEAIDRYVDEVSPSKRGLLFELRRAEAFKRDFAGLASAD